MLFNVIIVLFFCAPLFYFLFRTPRYSFYFLFLFLPLQDQLGRLIITSEGGGDMTLESSSRLITSSGQIGNWFFLALVVWAVFGGMSQKSFFSNKLLSVTFLLYFFKSLLFLLLPSYSFTFSDIKFPVFFFAMFFCSGVQIEEMVKIFKVYFLFVLALGIGSFFVFPQYVLESSPLALLPGFKDFFIGTFSTKNFFGQMLGIFIILEIAWPAKSRLYRIIIFIIGFLCLVLSFSKSSLGGVVICLLLSFYLPSKFEKKSPDYFPNFFRKVFVPFLFSFFIYLGLSVFFSSMDENTKDSLTSLTGRTVAWTDLVTLIIDRPILGYGQGVFRANSSLLPGLALSHAHNEFLSALLTGGVVGLGFFFFFLKTFYSQTFECLRKGNPGPFLLFIFFVVTGSFESMLDRFPGPILLAFAIVGSRPSDEFASELPIAPPPMALSLPPQVIRN